jgi:hypothetical protein
MLARQALYHPFLVLGISKLELFVLDWLQPSILLISTSRVARITGVSHQHLAK